MHSNAQKIADHLSERLIFGDMHVLRDVTQNVAFAVIILDKNRAKEQVFPGIDGRDFVMGIPRHDFEIFSLRSHLRIIHCDALRLMA